MTRVGSRSQESVESDWSAPVRSSDIQLGRRHSIRLKWECVFATKVQVCYEMSFMKEFVDH